MEYYVYELIDPRDNKVFYIGKGCKKRMYEHVKNVKRGYIPNESNVYLGNKIKKILSLGLKVEYKKVFITKNEQEAYNKEKELIAEIGLENLCNLTQGGLGGMFGRTHTKETKQKMRKSASKDTSMTKTPKAIENWKLSRKNYEYSDETRLKISMALTGKKLSTEHRKKISENHGMKGKTHTVEARLRISEGNRGKKISEKTKNKLRGKTPWNKGLVYRTLYTSDELTKNCPECGCVQQYNSKKSLEHAKRKCTLCKSCANSGDRNPSARNKNGEL